MRVFDHEKAAGYSVIDGETQYHAREAGIRVFRCHDGRVKRIVTEDSPDLFLTVAEVRSHVSQRGLGHCRAVDFVGRCCPSTRPACSTFMCLQCLSRAAGATRS